MKKHIRSWYNRRDLNIFDDRFLHEMTYKEIALRRDRSPERIKQICKDAVRAIYYRLRDRLTTEQCRDLLHQRDKSFIYNFRETYTRYLNQRDEKV